jgi:phage terminase large subunit-like protein
MSAPVPARRFTRAEALAVLADFVLLTPEQRRRMLETMPAPAHRALFEEWWWQARRGQLEPKACPDGAPWRIWAIVAGRGFGKTRAGAEWVWARARGDSLPGCPASGTTAPQGDSLSGCPRFATAGQGDSLSGCPRFPDQRRQATACPPSSLRIALVGATFDEVVRVMVEGESGLLALARSGERPRWIASRGLLLFPSGAQAHIFSAERPDKLRGPQHHYAWCDELATWRHADATWDNLMMGLRLGLQPQTVVTTTPRPVPALKRILALPRLVQTHGRTADNPDNAPDFIGAMEEMYAGTRLARQELEGLMLEDFEDALWTRELVEKARNRDSIHFPAPSAGASGRSGSENVYCPRSRFTRIVVGLDPPASTHGDSCGIVVCGKDCEGIAYILADLTAKGLTPEAWARRVASAAQEWGQLYTGGPAKVVAEKNQGGNMIESVLRAVDADLPLRLVPATASKPARAEPIALRFETGRVRLAGHFPELEDQMCALTWSGYQGPGSPDRLDAMVWAMTELFEKERAEPSVRAL